MTSLLPELHDWVELGTTGGKGLKQKSAASHATSVPVTPDHMPPCAAKPCHSSSPWANKDPFQTSPHCDHAELKQSVPLGCSLWSDPAFSLLQLCCFVSTSQAGSAFWVFLLGPVRLGKVTEAEMIHPLNCLIQCIRVFSDEFDLRGQGSWSIWHLKRTTTQF